MKSLSIRAWPPLAVMLLVLLLSAGESRAGSWNGIEPFKSRRADVIKILGEPNSDSAEGMLRFKVMGGSVQVSFVDAKFVAAKKLRPDTEGTVLQIVLQHEGSTQTPESMKLTQNRSFTREENNSSLVFRNMKDGIIYTFFQGTLKTTRYSFSDDQLSRARRR